MTGSYTLAYALVSFCLGFTGLLGAAGGDGSNLDPPSTGGAESSGEGHGLLSQTAWLSSSKFSSSINQLSDFWQII